MRALLFAWCLWASGCCLLFGSPSQTLHAVQPMPNELSLQSRPKKSFVLERCQALCRPRGGPKDVITACWPAELGAQSVLVCETHSPGICGGGGWVM